MYVLKNMILGVMTLLILIFILSLYLDLQLEKFDEDACRASIKSHELLAKRGVQITGAEFNCPTEYNTLDTDDEMEIKYKIADEMVECWDDFGNGRLVLFDDEMVYCSVCNVVDFRHKDISVDGFTTFLGTRLAPDKNVTYMDHLMGYEVPRTREYLDDPSIYDQEKSRLENQIDTSKNYSIVYIHAKGEKKIAQLKQALGGKTRTSVIMGMGVLGTGAAVTAGIIIATPVGWAAGTAIAVTGGIISLVAGAWTGITTFVAGEEDHHIAFVLLKEHTASEFDELGCDYFPSVQNQYTENNK